MYLSWSVLATGKKQHKLQYQLQQLALLYPLVTHRLHCLNQLLSTVDQLSLLRTESLHKTIYANRQVDNHNKGNFRIGRHSINRV